MPAKKKSSRKKRKKKETVDAKKAWAVDGRKDARGLAKALPETALGLKSGDVDVNDAAAQLAMLGSGDRMMEFRRLPLKANPNETDDWVVAACAHLALKVFPRSSSRELMAEFSEQLYTTLTVNRHDPAGARGLTEFHSNALQTAFDQVAGEWEPRIQRMTRRQLMQTCDVYKVSREAFLAFVHQFLEENFDTSHLRAEDGRGIIEEINNKHVEMLHVTKSLARGDDEVVRTCWFCGKHDRATSHCSKCHAARYCSRDCQVKSWKEDHKNVCAELKVVYESFTNDLKRVDKAMEEGVAGIQPTPRFDYMMVGLLRDHKYTLEEMFLSDVSGTLHRPPSMDAFYRNLTYIINGGDHWLFEDTPNPSFAEGSFMKGGVRPVTRDEAADCTLPMAIMACDISGLPEDKLETFKEKCLGYYKQTFYLDGCTWTAERLLQIYSTFDSVFAPRGAKESRTGCVVEVVKWLRKTYTKSGE